LEFNMLRTPRFFAAHRSSSLTGAFAGLAFAAALTVTAGPAFAQSTPGLDRVEVSSNAPLRVDVRENCHGIDTQLQDALQTTWMNQGQRGQVKVQFSLGADGVSNVRARGMSHQVERMVTHAMNQVDCKASVAAAGKQNYGFLVVFTDPEHATQTASMAGGQVVAMMGR
jgi:hypothetical protein